MEGGPDTSDIRRSLAAAGLNPAIYEPPPPVDVWPENEYALTVFLAMRTQWNVGPGGPIGLRYEALDTVWSLLSIKRQDRPDAFAGLQVMENEAMVWVAEKHRHD